jgi:hypothetical protein
MGGSQSGSTPVGTTQTGNPLGMSSSDWSTPAGQGLLNDMSQVDTSPIDWSGLTDEMIAGLP